MRSSTHLASSTSPILWIVGRGILRRMRDFVFESIFPTSKFGWLRPNVNHNCLCFFLFLVLHVQGLSLLNLYFSEVVGKEELGTAIGAFEMLTGGVTRNCSQIWYGFRHCWSVWLSLIVRSGLDDSKCRSQLFPCENVPVRQMMKSHSVLGLVIRLNCPYLHLSFMIRWNVNSNRCRIVPSHQEALLCLYAQLPLNLLAL